MARAAWIIAGIVVFLSAAFLGVRLRQMPGKHGATDEVSQIRAAAKQAWESGSYNEVARLLRQVPDDDSFGAEARFLEGRALWKLNRWDAAESLWNRALELDIQVPQAGWHLLRFYYVEHRWREAEQLVLRLYDVEPDPRDRTLLLLELVRIDNERLTPAETVLMLEPVLALEPSNYHVMRVLGISYMQLRRAGEGLDMVQRAIRLRSDEIEGWFALVWCLFEAGELERLGQVWTEMPKTAREDPQLLRYRAMWAEAMGDLTEAENSYRATLRREPYDRKAHYPLARLLRNRGQDQQADEHETTTRRLDDAREALATCYTRATQQNDNPPVELCREFSQWCGALGRVQQAERWDQEPARRSPRGAEGSGVRSQEPGFSSRGSFRFLAFAL